MLQFVLPFLKTAASAGARAGAKQFAKRAPKTAKKVRDKFKQAKESPTAQTATRKTEPFKRFFTGKDLRTGKKLSERPVTTNIGTDFRTVGKALDVAGIAGIPFGIAETYKAATPIFTDEDFTKGDALTLAGSAFLASPGLKFGARAASRLFGKGTFTKPRIQRDPKTGKPILDEKGREIKAFDPKSQRVIRDRFVTQASPLERRKELIGLGIGSGLGIAGAFARPDQPQLVGLQELDEKTPEDKQFIEQGLDAQMGPNVKKVVEKLQKRPGQYTEEEARQQLLEAKAQDDAQAKESIQSTPTPEKEQVEQAEKQQEKIEKPPVEVAPNEIDMNKNPGQAIDDADTAAREKILTTPDNPTGNPALPPMPKDFYADGNLHSLMAAANRQRRDYTRMNNAMKEYENFISGEKEKTLSYEQYRKKFTEITGDANADSANLAMFKWAMAMMTGRSNEAGISGFMDIAGQAGLVYADDMAAIYAQDRQEKVALANSFMAYEQDAKRYLSDLEQGRLAQVIQNERQLIQDKVEDDQTFFNNRVALYGLYLEKMKILQEIQDAKNTSLAAPRKDQEYFLVKDDKALAGYRVERIGFTEEGKRVKFVMGEDGVEKIVPIGPEEFAGRSMGKKLDTARLNKDLTSLIAMNQGLQFTEIVLSMDKEVPIGSPGAVNQLLTRLGSLYRDWSPTASGDLPRSSADFDDGIKDMLFSSSQEGTGERTKEDNKAFNELMTEFNKERVRVNNEMDDIRKNAENSKFLNENAKRQIREARPGADRQRVVEQLAILRLIENRMKYIVANANKGEDRLTVADVTDASKGTALLRFFKPSDEAAADYKAIRFQLNESYTSLVKKYIMAGGDPNQVLEHEYPTFIKNYTAKIKAEKDKENKDTNQKLSVDELINKIVVK